MATVGVKNLSIGVWNLNFEVFLATVGVENLNGGVWNLNFEVFLATVGVENLNGGVWKQKRGDLFIEVVADFEFFPRFGVVAKVIFEPLATSGEEFF